MFWFFKFATPQFFMIFVLCHAERSEASGSMEERFFAALSPQDPVGK
jgi:hypothetical protein